MSVPAGRLSFLFFLASAFVPVLTDVTCADLGRSQWADIIEGNERLVQSAHGVLEITYSHTSPEQIEKLKSLAHLAGKPNEWERYVYTEQIAALNSTRAEWWRRGELERFQQVPIGRPLEDFPLGFDEVTAFDGNVVRTMADRDPEPYCSISSVERCAWKSTNRHYPYSILFEFYSTPYSEIVRRSPEFEEERIYIDGREATKLTIAHPKYADKRFILTFGDQSRLVERDYLRQWKGEQQDSPQLQERHEMKDYELIPTGGGNTIWFPKTWVIHLYANALGTLPGGEPVQYTTKTISIKKIQFNPEIPLEKFQIEFPPGVSIYDNLTGAGWVGGRRIVPDRVFSDLEGLMLENLEKGEDEHVADVEVLKSADSAQPQTRSNREEDLEKRYPISLVALCIGILLMVGVVALWAIRSRQHLDGK